MASLPSAIKGYVQNTVGDRWGPASWIQPAYRAIAAEFPLEEGAFLDLDAGTGWVAVHVAAGKPELDAVGLCVDEEQARLCDGHKQRRLNVSFRVGRAEEITYPVNTFGGALALGCAHRWSDARVVLDEVWRVLTPGARLLIYDALPDGEIPDGWITRNGAWPTDAAVRRHLRTASMSEDQWSTLKAAIKASKFGGGQEGAHGFYRRIVLTKA